MFVFENSIFFYHTAQGHYGTVPENEVSPHGQSGAFFVCDVHVIGTIYAKYQLYKINFPQKSFYTRTISSVTYLESFSLSNPFTLVRPFIFFFSLL